MEFSEFIAMKTRLVHNSVTKWAERTNSGAKSIVWWIRIGGEKNRKKNRKSRETTERPLLIQSTQETKKTIRRDSTVYSIIRQTSLCGLYPYKEQLVLSSEGTLLSFPIAGIKPYARLSRKSTCHRTSKCTIAAGLCSLTYWRNII